MNPICCGCCKEMRCKKNGVFIEINQWYYRSGDKYHCDTCNRSVIVGIGGPITAPPPTTLDSNIEVIKLEQ